MGGFEVVPVSELAQLFSLLRAMPVNTKVCGDEVHARAVFAWWFDRVCDRNAWLFLHRAV